MFNLSRWNWTGPKIDPATKKLFHLPTAELAKCQPVAGQLDFGTDQFGPYIEFIAESGAADSASTKNSTYPRSELRETLPNGDDKEANWPPAKSIHCMSARLRVVQLAKSKKAIIGQIHGESDHPPLKIQVTGSTVYAQLRRKLNGKEDKPVIGTFTPDEPFTYEILIDDGGAATIWFNGKKVIEDYQFDLTSYANDSWYWKAGMYSQEKAKGGTGTGRVRFYALDTTGVGIDKPVQYGALIDAASKLPRKAMLTELNRITNLIDEAEMPDEEQAPLYARIKSLK